MNDIFFCEMICLLAIKTQYTACYFSWLSAHPQSEANC